MPTWQLCVLQECLILHDVVVIYHDRTDRQPTAKDPVRKSVSTDVYLSDTGHIAKALSNFEDVTPYKPGG